MRSKSGLGFSAAILLSWITGGVGGIFPASARAAQSEVEAVSAENPTVSTLPLDEFERQAEVQHTHPRWAFEFVVSPQPFGGNDINPIQAGIPARGVEFDFDYQPWAFQRLRAGMLDLGISTGIDPIMSDLVNGTSRLSGTNYFSFWTIGAQIRYQAYFSPRQVFVPVASYVFQSLAYDFSGSVQSSGSPGPSGRVGLHGPSLGLWLLLNVFSRSEAATFYSDWGVSRSYLVAEWRNLSGGNSDVTVSGTSVYLGFRVER